MCFSPFLRWSGRYATFLLSPQGASPPSFSTVAVGGDVAEASAVHFAGHPLPAANTTLPPALLTPRDKEDDTNTRERGRVRPLQQRTQIHTGTREGKKAPWDILVRVICTHIYPYSCVYLYICTYISVYVCIYKHMYVWHRLGTEASKWASDSRADRGSKFSFRFRQDSLAG